MMALFTCPQCGHSQAVEDKHVGKSATCPKCKTQAPVKAGSFPVEVPAMASTDVKARNIVHTTLGHLGIRCDSWMDSERHINKASSLRIEALTVIDESLPIRFAEPCGLVVHNTANDYPLNLIYQGAVILRCCDEPVTAFETRHMTFNVWGEHVSTLRSSEVRNLEPGKRIRLEPAWYLYSESDANEFSMSLNFVSRVRLASGTLRVADTAFVLREAQRIAEKVTESDLEPRLPKRA